MNVVWFKRDLRIKDHEALTQAAKHGPILPLYILEPELWNQPDMSYRHYVFLQDCLSDLSQSLEKLGQKLIIKVGDAVDILEELHISHATKSLWSNLLPTCLESANSLKVPTNIAVAIPPIIDFFLSFVLSQTYS